MESISVKDQELNSKSLKELIEYTKENKIDIKYCLEKSEIISEILTWQSAPSGIVTMKQFECPLCLDLLCEPVTTLCGHSFCRTCLVQAMQKCKHVCPQCRESCHIDAKVLG
jgi:hypothetical protein